MHWDLHATLQHLSTISNQIVTNCLHIHDFYLIVVHVHCLNVYVTHVSDCLHTTTSSPRRCHDLPTSRNLHRNLIPKYFTHCQILPIWSPLSQMPHYFVIEWFYHSIWEHIPITFKFCQVDNPGCRSLCQSHSDQIDSVYLLVSCRSVSIVSHRMNHCYATHRACQSKELPTNLTSRQPESTTVNLDLVAQ